jgi:hypothetical protein
VGGHGIRKSNIIRRGMSKSKGRGKKKKNLQVECGQAQNGRGVNAAGGVTTKGREQHREMRCLEMRVSKRETKKKKKDAHLKGHRQRGPQRGHTIGMVLEKECQQGKQCE